MLAHSMLQTQEFSVETVAEVAMGTSFHRACKAVQQLLLLGLRRVVLCQCPDGPQAVQARHAGRTAGTSCSQHAGVESDRVCVGSSKLSILACLQGLTPWQAIAWAAGT